jgi:hypothetical protein
MLPNFLLRFRQYVLRVIQQVVAARMEKQQSWAELRASCSVAGLPALRTLQRWCKSFGGEGVRWLGKVQETLAQQDSRSGWLDPQGEAPRAENVGAALLAASEHLLAWAKTQWEETASYGRNERLHFLWLWGVRQGLGRLV